MPTGKLAAMVAHAGRTFLLKRACFVETRRDYPFGQPPIEDCHVFQLLVTPEQSRWMVELDPGLEDVGQVSMATIVCAASDEAHLLSIERAALAARLECHRVVDSGYSHNKPRTFAALGIGPDWPERLDPVTGGLKVYR